MTPLQRDHMAKIQAMSKTPAALAKNKETWGKRSRFARSEPRTAIEAVRTLMAIVDASDMSDHDICRKAGVNISALSDWRGGKSSPTLITIGSVGQVLGFKLKWEPIE